MKNHTRKISAAISIVLVTAIVGVGYYLMRSGAPAADINLRATQEPLVDEVVPSVSVATPPSVSDAVREPQVPEPRVRPTRWSRNSDLDSRLGKMRWNFAKKLRNSEMVLANDYCNPDAKTLSEADRKELDTMLTAVCAEASKMEFEYQRTLDAHVDRCLEEGKFEPVFESDYEKPQTKFKPTNPEEEVVAVWNNREGDCIVRVGWDDDPAVAAGRSALLDFKVKAMSQVVDFVATKGIHK